MQNRLFSRVLSCERALRLLDRFVSDDLPADTTRQVEIHLAGCDPCRKQLRALERVVLLVEALPRRVPPVDLWPRVARQIQQAPEAAPWHLRFGSRFLTGSTGDRAASRPTWRIPGFVAASAAAAAVIGVTVWGGGTPVSDAGATFRLPAARQMVPDSYVSQAQQVAFFEPLADRASLSTISAVSERATGGPAQPIPAYPQVRIENAISTSYAGGSGQ